MQRTQLVGPAWCWDHKQGSDVGARHASTCCWTAPHQEQRLDQKYRQHKLVSHFALTRSCQNFIRGCPTGLPGVIRFLFLLLRFSYSFQFSVQDSKVQHADIMQSSYDFSTLIPEHFSRFLFFSTKSRHAIFYISYASVSSSNTSDLNIWWAMRRYYNI